MNADDSTTALALYNDVWKWRKLDKDFNEKVEALIPAEKLQQNKALQGRPPKDDGDTSWYQKFADDLRKSNGNWTVAAKKSPYSLRQIREFIDPGSTSFRKELNDLVGEVFMEVAGDLQEMFFSLRDPENFESFEAVKIAQSKAWIALKGLEKVDPQRWGRRAEVNVSGNIKHVHSQESQDHKDAMLLQLWEERKQFFDKKKQLQLESHVASTDESNVIDAEVVEPVNADTDREV